MCTFGVFFWPYILTAGHEACHSVCTFGKGSGSRRPVECVLSVSV